MRVTNWPSIMAVELERVRNLPFTWGSHDCALAAAEFIRLITGIDCAQEFRGKYDSALGAYRVLEPDGGLVGMVRRFATEYKWREVTPPFAQRGDLVCADLESGETLGICLGVDSYFPSKAGATFRKTTSVKLAWRII